MFKIEDISMGCLLFMVISNAGAQSKNISLNDLLGDWLNRDYVEMLQKTKSPMASLTMRYSDMTFTKNASCYKWIVGENFHSAVRVNNIDSLFPSCTADTYVLEFNKNQYGSTLPIPENDRLVYSDGSPDTITWVALVNGREERVQFVRVKPTMELYVNRVVLAGEYTDVLGRKFLFTDDSKALWPDKTFSYILGIDHLLTKCDYFYIPTENYHPYSYKWKDDKLIIYNVLRPTEGFEAMYPSGEPIYTLTPDK